MRISDWSSDVCSSDLYSATFRADDAAQFAEMANTPRHPAFYTRYGNPVHKRVEAILAELEGTETALLMASGTVATKLGRGLEPAAEAIKIGRASCRERVCQ